MSSDSTLMSIEQLERDVTQQQVLFNELRINPTAGSSELDEARKKLSQLKMELGKVKGKASGPADAANGKRKGRLLLKTAKVGKNGIQVADDSHRILGYQGLWPHRDVLS